MLTSGDVRASKACQEWLDCRRNGDDMRGRKVVECIIIIIIVLPLVAFQSNCQCLAQPMGMPLAVVSSWVEQAVLTMGQNSRCCMVCMMPQSQVSVKSFEYPHFGMFTLDRTTCVRNRLSVFQVVQGLRVMRGSLRQLEGVRQH